MILPVVFAAPPAFFYSATIVIVTVLTADDFSFFC